MMHKLEVDSVQLHFGEKKILSDIYFECKTGKITGLLGKNCAGKSCLLKLSYGTLNCEKTVRIDNQIQNNAFKKYRQITYLPQHNFIPKSCSIKRVFSDFNLDYHSFLNTFPAFAHKDQQAMGELSGGECRLIELYIILKAQSLFVLLDEPFTHIDPLQIETIKVLLQEEKKKKGILISDHLYQHVLDVCDSVYLLKNAKLHLVNNIQNIDQLGYANLQRK